MKRKLYKSNIRGKLFLMTAVGILLLTAVFLIVYMQYEHAWNEKRQSDLYGQTVVELNSIDKQLGTSNPEVHEELQALILAYQGKQENESEEDKTFIVVFYVCALLFMLVLFAVVYVLILRPFHELEGYADEIAAGNLDVELNYKRVNMFGQFTWAFDHMRKEINRARKCEQEAVENNKTVIATLSHDIKTPIASIRAYSEALAENMDQTPERRNRYIEVITRKCDEVTKITDDMFLHALHDLDKLVIKKEPVDMQAVIEDTISSMEGAKSDIILDSVKPYTLKEGDPARIAQVIENIINNARKYADGKIYVETAVTEEGYRLDIRDEGNGISPEDMPFIFDKFYRGSNHGDKPGAGLGLFIVKYVMEQMGGTVTLLNGKDGLTVRLDFFNKL